MIIHWENRTRLISLEEYHILLRWWKIWIIITTQIILIRSVIYWFVYPSELNILVKLLFLWFVFLLIWLTWLDRLSSILSRYLALFIFITIRWIRSTVIQIIFFFLITQGLWLVVTCKRSHSLRCFHSLISDKLFIVILSVSVLCLFYFPMHVPVSQVMKLTLDPEPKFEIN